MTRKLRVLLTKSDQDGHERGVRSVATALKNGGVEVIFTRYRIIDEVVSVAIEEDVDMVGFSFQGHGIMYDMPKFMSMLKEQGGSDIKVVVGGTISDEERMKLLDLGVSKVFMPGMSTEDLPDQFRKWDSDGEASS